MLSIHCTLSDDYFLVIYNFKEWYSLYVAFISCLNNIITKFWHTIAGKSFFLAPLTWNSDNGITPDAQNANPVSVHPIPLDDARQSTWVGGYDL